MLSCWHCSSFDCAISICCGNRELDLPAPLLSQIALRHLSLTLDMYFEPDESDDEAEAEPTKELNPQRNSESQASISLETTRAALWANEAHTRAENTWAFMLPPDRVSLDHAAPQPRPSQSSQEAVSKLSSLLLFTIG